MEGLIALDDIDCEGDIDRGLKAGADYLTVTHGAVSVSQTKRVTSYAVSPALPAGLSLNAWSRAALGFAGGPHLL